YFTIPIFAYRMIYFQWKRLGEMNLGFLIPVSFCFLPLFGPPMAPVFEGIGHRDLPRAFGMVLSVFLSYFEFTPKYQKTPFLVLSLFFLSYLMVFMVWERGRFKKVLNSLPETSRLFLMTLGFQLILIPLLFSTRSYVRVDFPYTRYLWLWHYSVYFF